MKAFSLSNQGVALLWQEMRDAAKWEYEASENDQDRDAKLAIAALGNESVDNQAKYDKLLAIAKFAKDLL